MDAIDYLIKCFKTGKITRDEMLVAFGSRARMSETMNRKRGLSIRAIRRFHFIYGLDASMLLKTKEPK